MISWKQAAGFGQVARRRALLVALSVLLVACAPPAPSQKSFSIAIDLRCTTCNEFIQCAANDVDAANAATELTVYRVNEKSFWAQVATIGDYLRQLTHSKTTDERPLTVYRREQGQWHVVDTGKASVDIVAAQIDLQEAGGARSAVSQRDGLWRSTRGAGQCRALQRREGFALIRQMLGRPLPPHTPAASGAKSAGASE